MVVEINLATHGSELKSAYKAVLDQNDPCNWIVLGYEKGTNDLKVSAQGDGDLDELVEEFEDDKVLYAFAKVEDPNTQLPKFIFISWCGESAPVKRKGLLGSHLNDVQNFLKGYHIQINGRDQEDVTPQQIMKKLDESSGAKYSYHEQSRSDTVSKNPPKTSYKTTVSTTNSYTHSVSQTLKSSAAPAAPQKPVVAFTSNKLQNKFLNQVEQSDKERLEREEQERFEKQFREKANIGQSGTQPSYGGSRRTNSEALEREERLLRQQMEKARASRQGESNNDFEEKRRAEAEEANRKKEEGDRLKREEAERKREEAAEQQRERELEKQRQDELEEQRQAQLEEQRRAQDEEASASERRQQADARAAEERQRQEAQQKEERRRQEEDRADEARQLQEVQQKEEQRRQEEFRRNEEAEAESKRTLEEERLERERMLELAAEEAKQLSYNPDLDHSEAPAVDRATDSNAIALFEYQAADEGEIDMREGELITNIIQLDEGWWQGTNEAGVSGVFPANYVELVPTAAPTQAEDEYHQESNEVPASNTAYAIAIYDYEATEEGELTFGAADTITDIEFVSDDWWSGTNPLGETGLFPANYVELQQ